LRKKVLLILTQCEIQVYFYLRDYSKSISDNTKAIEINPNNAKAFNNRGITYNKLKDYLG